MNDLTNDGALAPADDASLFNDVTDLGAQAPEPAAALTATSPEPAASAPATPEPAIPPSRLREEAEARRAAERERDELRGRLQAFESQQKPPAKPQRPDIFEDPNAFVDQGVREAVDPIQQSVAQMREFYSQRDAFREHGKDKVTAAFQALDQAAKAGDPEAQATVERVKSSMHPFGDIVDWHAKQTVYSEVGSDPKAYRQRIIDEALKDPEVQKKFLETTRQSAQANGSTFVPPKVSSSPSLSRVGSAALPEGQDDASDAEIFASTTRRKRA